MDTVDLLKQLEINYKLMGNDLEFSSHALDSLLKAAARCVLHYKYDRTVSRYHCCDQRTKIMLSVSGRAR